jgi:hypothetical protein
MIWEEAFSRAFDSLYEGGCNLLQDEGEPSASQPSHFMPGKRVSGIHVRVYGSQRAGLEWWVKVSAPAEKRTPVSRSFTQRSYCTLRDTAWLLRYIGVSRDYGLGRMDCVLCKLGYPEDGNNRVLQNIGTHVPNYTTSNSTCW